MALIKCGECGREISSKARTCPQCGNPITAAGDVNATGAPLTTTQWTAKKFKAHMLWATALCCIAVVMLVSDDVSWRPWGTSLFLIGFAWFFATRIRAWWHHG